MIRPYDNVVAMELERRRTMEIASDRLLAALREEHPRIIAHLTRGQNGRRA
jgi:hypothetical protein